MIGILLRNMSLGSWVNVMECTYKNVDGILVNRKSTFSNSDKKPSIEKYINQQWSLIIKHHVLYTFIWVAEQ